MSSSEYLKMAYDVLSVLIIIIALESAFSVGSRVIDIYEASLETNTCFLWNKKDNI